MTQDGMLENDKINTIASVAETPEVDDEKNKTRHTSKGEWLFNLGVYGGISGLAVFIAGIPTGYWAQYGGASKIFESGRKLLNRVGIKGHTAEKAIILNSFLNIPGTAAIFPIKAIENHKIEIVTKLNKMLGDETDTSDIKNEPPLTWSSLVKARVLAWLSVFVGFKGVGMLAGKERFETFENKFAEHVFCKPFNKPTHVNGIETKRFRYGKIASLDSFATVAATVLLYSGSHFFARLEMRRERLAARAAARAAAQENKELAVVQKESTISVTETNIAPMSNEMSNSHSLIPSPKKIEPMKASYADKLSSERSEQLSDVSAVAAL